MNKNLGIIDRERACLVVIDVQEKFRPVIFEIGKLVENVKKLVGSFRILRIPIIVTEQNPKKLGKTLPEIAGVLGNFKPVKKIYFSCFGDKNFLRELEKTKAKDLVLCGIESHVCVLKTALDGLKRGYNVHVVYDAVSSRKQFDWSISICRLSHSGIFMTTTESVIFQLMDRAGTQEFRKINRIMK